MEMKHDDTYWSSFSLVNRACDLPAAFTSIKALSQQTPFQLSPACSVVFPGGHKFQGHGPISPWPLYTETEKAYSFYDKEAGRLGLFLLSS